LQITLGRLRPQAKARPISTIRAVGALPHYDKASVEEPLQSLLDFVGGKIPPQLPDEFSKRTSICYFRCQRAIELAVKEELPVLGIETHDIGWQHIDGEIRRELQNVFAGMVRNGGPAIACHEVNIHTLPQLLTDSARRILRLRDFRRLMHADAF
jgi:hypothetical protein